MPHNNPGRLVVITGLPGSGKTTLATELAAVMPAIRMCPDDWMMAAGIDLWDEAARAAIEALQMTLVFGFLESGHNVVIELWTRIVDRDREGKWGARSIERHELEEWTLQFQAPTDDEFATYDTASSA